MNLQELATVFRRTLEREGFSPTDAEKITAAYMAALTKEIGHE